MPGLRVCIRLHLLECKAQRTEVQSTMADRDGIIRREQLLSHQQGQWKCCNLLGVVRGGSLTTQKFPRNFGWPVPVLVLCWWQLLRVRSFAVLLTVERVCRDYRDFDVFSYLLTRVWFGCTTTASINDMPINKRVPVCRSSLLSGQNVSWSRSMLPLVSYWEHADGTDKRTDGRTPDRYFMFPAKRGQRN